MTNDAARDLLAALPHDPLVFPLQLDLIKDQAAIVRLSPEILASHSFLDQRVLPASPVAAFCPWADIARAAALAPPKAPAYIFHIGHCGSTLVSRLVSEATDTAGLREPLILRTFAIDLMEGDGGFLGPGELRARLSVAERLWARGTRSVVIKATSMCNDLALLVAAKSGKAFLYQVPEIHLALTLAGPAAEADLRGFAQMRRRRLGARGIAVEPLANMSAGALAAMTWLCECVSARSAMQSATISAFDFDAVLRQPAEALQSICAALGLNASRARCAAAIAGPTMRAYSKAQEHPFDAAARGAIIAQAKSDRAGEIRRGMDWLQGIARSNPEAAATLAAFGGTPSS